MKIECCRWRDSREQPPSLPLGMESPQFGVPQNLQRKAGMGEFSFPLSRPDYFSVTTGKVSTVTV